MEIFPLIKEVRAILVNEMHCNQVQMDVFDNDPLIMACQDPTYAFESQRYNLNRFWTNQLNMIPDSSKVRFMLLPRGTRQEWVDVFTKTVVPFLMDHNLPKQLTYI